MEAVTLIGIIVVAVLGILLGDRLRDERKLKESLKEQKEANQELLKRIPVAKEGGPDLEPLTLDKIADAVRFNGYIPEKRKDTLVFRVQGDNYLIDTEQLPIFFVIKGFFLNPTDWEMDVMREAAHVMSDKLAIVKATFLDDDSAIRFIVGAQDRNYESFKDNLMSYLRIIENAERVMHEEYDRLVGMKHDAALAAQPFISSSQQENKVVS